MVCSEYLGSGAARDVTPPPAYLHLAAAVIVRAMKDAQGRDADLAAEAREWLEGAGREWGEVLGGIPGRQG